ncbi:hypothetical protein M9Y10_024617 [Tritrichomonas musculus]|uniref:Protein kinase domain-containing protein n=1 Tax=Tritrichomonas musculus TaxID=1915356 RepID=A0ABR2HAS4_9EUKA
MSAIFDQSEVNFKDYKQIGSIFDGLCSRIYLYEDKKTGKKITIKISKQEVNKGMEKSFKNQIQKFNSIINPAILHLSNFILSDAQNKILNPIFLTEYMPKGSLKNFLELKEKQTQIILNDTKKYVIFIGIALGMKSIHDNNIIHGNLDPSHILLDDNYYPKIKVINFSQFIQTEEGFSIYKSPEVYINSEFYQESDVYSFAFIAYQLFTGLPPIIKSKTEYQKMEQIRKGKRPDTSMIKDEQLVNFLNGCWSHEPSERYSFKQIVNDILRGKYQSAFPVIDESEVTNYIKLFTSQDESLNERILPVHCTFENTITNSKFKLKIYGYQTVSDVIEMIKNTKKYNYEFELYTSQKLENESYFADYIYDRPRTVKIVPLGSSASPKKSAAISENQSKEKLEKAKRFDDSNGKIVSSPKSPRRQKNASIIADKSPNRKVQKADKSNEKVDLRNRSQDLSKRTPLFDDDLEEDEADKSKKPNKDIVTRSRSPERQKKKSKTSNDQPKEKTEKYKENDDLNEELGLNKSPQKALTKKYNWKVMIANKNSSENRDFEFSVDYTIADAIKQIEESENKYRIKMYKRAGDLKLNQVGNDENLYKTYYNDKKTQLIVIKYDIKYGFAIENTNVKYERVFNFNDKLDLIASNLVYDSSADSLKFSKNPSENFEYADKLVFLYKGKKYSGQDSFISLHYNYRNDERIIISLQEPLKMKGASSSDQTNDAQFIDNKLGPTENDKINDKTNNNKAKSNTNNTSNNNDKSNTNNANNNNDKSNTNNANNNNDKSNTNNANNNNDKANTNKTNDNNDKANTNNTSNINSNKNINTTNNNTNNNDTSAIDDTSIKADKSNTSDTNNASDTNNTSDNNSLSSNNKNINNNSNQLTTDENNNNHNTEEDIKIIQNIAYNDNMLSKFLPETKVGFKFKLKSRAIADYYIKIDDEDTTFDEIKALLMAKINKGPYKTFSPKMIILKYNNKEIKDNCFKDIKYKEGEFITVSIRTRKFIVIFDEIARTYELEESSLTVNDLQREISTSESYQLFFNNEELKGNQDLNNFEITDQDIFSAEKMEGRFLFNNGNVYDLEPFDLFDEKELRRNLTQKFGIDVDNSNFMYCNKSIKLSKFYDLQEDSRVEVVPKEINAKFNNFLDPKYNNLFKRDQEIGDVRKYIIESRGFFGIPIGFKAGGMFLSNKTKLFQAIGKIEVEEMDEDYYLKRIYIPQHQPIQKYFSINATGAEIRRFVNDYVVNQKFLLINKGEEIQDFDKICEFGDDIEVKILQNESNNSNESITFVFILSNNEQIEEKAFYSEKKKLFLYKRNLQLDDNTQYLFFARGKLILDDKDDFSILKDVDDKKVFVYVRRTVSYDFSQTAISAQKTQKELQKIQSIVVENMDDSNEKVEIKYDELSDLKTILDLRIEVAFQLKIDGVDNISLFIQTDGEYALLFDKDEINQVLTESSSNLIHYKILKGGVYLRPRMAKKYQEYASKSGIILTANQVQEIYWKVDSDQNLFMSTIDYLSYHSI